MSNKFSYAIMCVGDGAIAQLWRFWLAPIVGGILGAVVYRCVISADEE